jgi:nitrite reductase/ring-hydroxylating ferredoxin subunit
MNRLFARLGFILKHKTLNKVVLSSDSSGVFIFHKGRVVRMNRRCPHQGAPLEQGYLHKNHLVCPWHGCRFSLDEPEKARPYCMTLSKLDALSDRSERPPD